MTDPIEPGVLLGTGNQSEPGEGMLTRRRLMNGLLSGMLLHSIAPIDAIAEGNSGPAITDAMILDFLRRVLEVARHDNLTDRSFIGKTLGVHFTLVEERGPLTKREKDVLTHHQYYTLASPSDPVLQNQGAIRKHHYSVTTPRTETRAEASFTLVFDDFSGPQGISKEQMIEIFGEPQFKNEVSARVANAPLGGYIHAFYAYRWEGRNSTMARFMFSGGSGYLSDVEVFQNTVALKHYPL